MRIRQDKANGDESMRLIPVRFIVCVWYAASCYLRISGRYSLRVVGVVVIVVVGVPTVAVLVVVAIAVVVAVVVVAVLVVVAVTSVAVGVIVVVAVAVGVVTVAVGVARHPAVEVSSCPRISPPGNVEL